MMDFGDAANRGEIFRRALEDVLEFGERRLEIVELDQRAAQRDAGGEITRMKLETGAADVDGLLVMAGAAALLRQLGEGNRRRIRLDPASEIFNPLAVGHRATAP